MYRITIIILVILLIGSWVTNVGLFAALFGINKEAEDNPADSHPSFSEIWSSGHGTAKVVRLNLSGIIVRNEKAGIFGIEQDPVESLLKQIQCAKMDADVKAILLCIDSPGGSVTSSDEIYNALKLFRESQDGRRVFVHIRGLGASGAYYIAMAADYVMAEPTSIIGSIGVIIQNLNMKEFGDKFGISAVTIKSGVNKDLLNPFENIDTNQVEILQNVVNSLQLRFADLVKRKRVVKSEYVMDGRIFTAQDALKEGLIDSVGYLDDAIIELERLINEEDLYVIRYKQKDSFFGSFLESKAPFFSSIQSFNSPRFFYLWRP